MKKSIKAIAAITAAVTMAISCVPSVYAVKDVPAVSAETEQRPGVTFEEGETIEAPYNGRAEIISDDGTVYYQGYERKVPRTIFYTLDENGEIKNSYEIKGYVNDEGEKIGWANPEIKQCGDYIYVMYSETCGWSFRENVIIKLDKELNEISKNKFPKSQCIDTNGEKVVYLKYTSKIYICDMDGKNEKLLYTVNNSDGNVEQPLNSVAIAGNYVGFQKGVGYAPKTTDYCGIIDIETGEITLKEQRSVQQVFSSGDNLIWYGEQGYDTRDDGSVPAEVTDIRAYMDSVYKYYDDSELYVFDGENYSVIKTPHKKETGYGTMIDNKGNIITTSFDGKGNVTHRIYRNGKLLGEYTVSYKGYCGCIANNGVMMICYTGRDSTAADWIGYDPETTTPEELQAQLDKTPAAKDIMKSVTITYR